MINDSWYTSLKLNQGRYTMKHDKKDKHDEIIELIKNLPKIPKEHFNLKALHVLGRYDRRKTKRKS